MMFGAILAALVSTAAFDRLAIDPRAVEEILPHAVEALQISFRAAAREAAHERELKARGIGEEPPCDVRRYAIDVGAFGEFAFSDGGELTIDRRFVTDEEMRTVHAIEQWFKKWFGSSHKVPVRPPSALTVFRGFEDDRYQMHDKLIARLVGEFNADKATWCGASAEQAKGVPQLTAAMVKSHMIEESGGNGARSRAAWTVDPLQVNVPGDWSEEKTSVGLEKPVRRNEGTLEGNVRAGIMYLARKGFDRSAKPAKMVKGAAFAGWLEAFRRYNGRRDLTVGERYYSHEYAEKIMRRAASPDVFVPIEILLSAKAAQK